MKIKLVRTGGFIPVTKISETEVDLSEQELNKLLGKIQLISPSQRLKDGNNWEISVGDKVITIDPGKVPDEYAELFEKLKGNLKIVK
jgi:hypothetical protein